MVLEWTALWMTGYPEQITAFATTVTAIIAAIIAFYELVWQKRPRIKIVSIKKGRSKKGGSGHKGAIWVSVRNNSNIPLICSGSIKTDKGEYPLRDRHSPDRIRFKFTPSGIRELRGDVDSSNDIVKLEIHHGGKKPKSKRFSLKELVEIV